MQFFPPAIDKKFHEFHGEYCVHYAFLLNYVGGTIKTYVNKWSSYPAIDKKYELLHELCAYYEYMVIYVVGTIKTYGNRSSFYPTVDKQLHESDH